MLQKVAAISVTLAAMTGAHASQRNWIDRYIAAHGHCQQQPNGPFTTLNPMEKPIEEWTDQDLVDLKAALDRCDALPESETGVSRLWTGQLYERYASLVHEAQRRAALKQEAAISEQEHAAQEEATRQHQIEADKQAEVARIEALKRADEKQIAERKAAEERTAAMAEELKAASKLAEETEARAQAARAEAQARYNVEAAKRRAADAEAQIRNADAQARAERQQADCRFAEAHPESYEPPPRQQAPVVHLSAPNFGCSSEEIYVGTLAAVALNNTAEAKHLTRLGLENGSCVPLQPGAYSMLQDKDKIVCIAPVGSNETCRWVAATIVQR